MPMISIIVPVYKVEPYLRRCVDSILSQSNTDFELILVDDGSPDNCGAICDAYAEQDERVFVIHQSNGGLSAARNAGIDWAFANSDSQWLTFIDSDDWVHPQYLEILFNATAQTGCRISLCFFTQSREYEIPVITDSKPVARTPESFWCEHNGTATVAWGKLYRKDLFHDVRYPVGKLHEDEYTTYRLLFREETVAVINARLYCYFINTDSITKSKWTPRRLDKLRAMEEQAAYFCKNGFQSALQYRAEGYAEYVKDAIELSAQQQETAKRSREILRSSAKHMLHQYRRHFSLKKHRSVYEAAFPLIAGATHLAGRICRTLHLYS